MVVFFVAVVTGVGLCVVFLVVCCVVAVGGVPSVVWCPAGVVLFVLV